MGRYVCGARGLSEYIVISLADYAVVMHTSDPSRVHYPCKDADAKSMISK